METLLLIILLAGKFYLIYIIWLNTRLEKVQEKDLAQHKLQALQLSAYTSLLARYFIKNMISNVRNEIGVNYEGINSSKYFSSVFKLVNQTLSICGSNLISLKDEINYVEHYIGIEKYRLQNNLDVSIKVDHSLNPSKTYLPGMLLQPFVEYAIIQMNTSRWKNSISFEFVKELKGLLIKINYSYDFKLRKNINGVDLNLSVKSKGISLVEERIKLYEVTDRLRISYWSDSSDSNSAILLKISEK